MSSWLAPDSYFTAKLVDVSECGTALNLTELTIPPHGATRAPRPRRPTPGKVEKFKIDMRAQLLKRVQEARSNPSRNQLLPTSQLLLLKPKHRPRVLFADDKTSSLQ